MNEYEKLYSWISSWKQKDGYGGFLHHAIHGTVNWEHAKLVPSYTYEPLINSFINIYEKTGNSEWLDKAIEAAEDLIGIIDRVGQFKYSGFEFAPKGGSIVHTINPLFALMKLYKITKIKKYIKVVKHVLESVVSVFWRGNNYAGPFNMTLMTSAAIAEYCKISGNWKLNELYGCKSFEIIKNHRVGKEGGAVEGLYYRNSNDHSIIFPWYNSVKASAMIRYGNATENSYWIEEGIHLLKIIKTLFSTDYLLPHSYQPDKNGVFHRVESPVLVAPVAYTISLMQQNDVMSEQEVKYAIKCIMKRQTSIGFIPANIGYDWRSKVGVTAWNCFVMELLSQNYLLSNIEPISLLDYEASYEKVKIKEDATELKFFYCEDLFVKIIKKTGQIIHYKISDPMFILPYEFVGKAVHVVRINRQRHYAVSYIDMEGRGIWLENYSGMNYTWSPYYLFKYKNNQLMLAGRQKYNKFSLLLYIIIRPILYRFFVVNIITKKLDY